MEISELKQEVETILIIGREDAEWAHGTEDRVYRDVLQAIADGHPDAQELAQIALKTQTGGFSRWCA